MGRFRLVRRLGRGGFGEVWEAHDERDERRVAVKFLDCPSRPSPESLERFRREAILAASISHPRCAGVLSAEELEGHPVIVMELVEGGTLQDRLRCEGRLPFREAVDAVLDVVEGLEAAHARGVIHRDVKPSNCFVTGDGRVKIGDFGLSKTPEFRDELTRPGSFVGTPLFSAPEQVRGEETDFRADLYSVGATLFALLAGEPPFQGKTSQQVFARVLTEPPPSLETRGATVPPGLESAVRRMLEKEPARRFASYRDLHQALWPFSSRGVAPADRGLHLVASVTDLWLIMLSALVVGVAADRVDLWHPGLLGDPLRLLQGWLVGLGVLFPFLDWRFGGTPGARLLGLRVGAASFAALTPAASARRGALLWVTFVPFLVAEPGYPLAWAPLLLLVLPFGPDGISLLEWLSRTRLQVLLAGPTTEVPAEAAKATAAFARQRLGPFEVSGTYWARDGESLLRGRDTVLRRDVWIHATDVRSPGRSPAQRAVSRPGQLRWLQSGVAGDLRWDAFEPPSGASVRRWVADKGPRPWSEAGTFACGVLAEVAARLEAGEPPDTPVWAWANEGGAARLLDFPPPGEPDDAGTPIGEWRSLVARLLVQLMERWDRDGAQGPPQAPLSRAVRAALARPTGSGAPASPEEFQSTLQLLGAPGGDSLRFRRIRAALLGVVPVTLLAAAVVTASWDLLVSESNLRQIGVHSLLAVRVSQLVERSFLFVAALVAAWSGAAFALSGLEATSSRGRRARFARPLLRAGLLAFPFFLAVFATGTPTWPPPPSPTRALLLWGLGGILYPLLLLYGASRVGGSGRSLSDRMAGLHFVPAGLSRSLPLGGRLARAAAIAMTLGGGLLAFELAVLVILPFVGERLGLERAAIGPVSLSRETTFVTEPLGSDGLPDYVALLNASKTPPVAENAAVSLLSGLVMAGDSAARSRLGAGPPPLAFTSRAAASPDAEAWLRDNAGRLDRLAAAVAEARRRARFWMPLDGRSLSQGHLPSPGALLVAAEGLRARARLFLDRGDHARAVEDLTTGLRLGRILLLEPDAPLLYRMVGWAIDGAALESVIDAAPHLRQVDCERLLPEIRSANHRPALARDSGIADRLVSLDSLLLARRLALRDGPRRWTSLFLLARPGDPELLRRIPPSAIDWDHALRVTNRFWDLRSALVSATELGAGRAAAEAFVRFASRLEAEADLNRVAGASESARGAARDGRTRRAVAEGFAHIVALLPSPAAGFRAQSDLRARAHLASVALAQRAQWLGRRRYFPDATALWAAAGAPPPLACGTRFADAYSDAAEAGFEYELRLEGLTAALGPLRCLSIDARGGFEAEACHRPADRFDRDEAHGRSGLR